MGVDTWGFAERRINDRWEFAGAMIPNPDLEYDSEVPPIIPEELFHESVREFAAILVDMSNPIRSTEAYTPVVEVRGMPPDLSPQLADWFKDEDNLPAGQVNWFTVRELIDFGLEKRTMRRRAYVDKEVAHLFEGCPVGFPWSKWPEQIPYGISVWSRDGTEVEWIETYADIIDTFYADVMPALANMGEPENVRVIVLASY